MSMTVCPGCHKEIELGSAAFCPFCGRSLMEKAVPQITTPPEVEAGLAELQKDIIPKKKLQIIDELLSKYPDDFRLNEEKLFATKVMDPKARKLDFSIIKCHLLMYYLTPEDFSNDQKAAMRHELFHHEQLEKCQSLVPDADAFTRRYLNRMAQEFINIFLHSSTQYNRSILGFRFEKRMDRNLAAPVARMMANVYRDGGLTTEQRDLLYEALFRGMRADVGNTSFLEEYLREAELPVPSIVG